MPAITPQRLIEMLRQSRLISASQIDAELEELRKVGEGQLPETPGRIAEHFVKAGLLTPWHREKLMQGKYKGFFLGKYKLIEPIGRGGMSHVYLAEHVLMKRQLAVKVLPKNRVNDSSYLDRFHREAQATASLDHRNIVRAYDVDHDGKDNHYIVMEYVDGADLNWLVRENGPLDYETAANYIAQAAEGLEHAHAANLIHRDIKPGNLLVDQVGVVKLLDLGLALIKDDERASLTIVHNENVLGTADYLAPEQAINSHDIDYRADIYALGCTFYYLLAGHPPFPVGTLAQRIAKHQSVDPPSISSIRKDCPAELAEMIHQMMAKRPEDRIQTAALVGRRLQNWLSESSSEAAGDAARVAETAVAARESGSPPASAGSPPASTPTPARHGGGTSPQPYRYSEDTDPTGAAETMKGMPEDSPGGSSTIDLTIDPRDRSWVSSVKKRRSRGVAVTIWFAILLGAAVALGLAIAWALSDNKTRDTSAVDVNMSRPL